MRRTILLVALLLLGCADPAQQAKLDQALLVACDIDGVVVPVAVPVVVSTGQGGATVANDALLVHPAVVQACAALKGKPAGVTVTEPPPVPAARPTT